MSAPASTATTPGPGSYDPAPLNVQLPNGSTSYTQGIIDDVVTASGKFEVVWRAVNVRQSGTVTIECNPHGRQVRASDTHMLMYSNSSQVSDEAGIESTCSQDPAYQVVLKPGQSVSFFAEFATPPPLGNQIEISQLDYSSIQFNPYSSYAFEDAVTPAIPQWMLPVLECVIAFIPGHAGKGINAVVGAGTLPFGLSAAIQEFGNKPAPTTVAGFYEVFRQLPAVPFGACLPAADQIQQWLNANHGAPGPGAPGPPEPTPPEPAPVSSPTTTPTPTSPAKPTPTAAHTATPTPSTSVTFTVSSTVSWRQTSIYLTGGQRYSVQYVSGNWTVDYRNFPYVGPGGYSDQEDAKIYQDCKFDANSNYGVLFGVVGETPNGAFPIGNGGTFTAAPPSAYVNGAGNGGYLYLRINDTCLTDNAGSVTMRVTTANAAGTNG